MEKAIKIIDQNIEGLEGNLTIAINTFDTFKDTITYRYLDVLKSAADDIREIEAKLSILRSVKSELERSDNS